MMLLRCNDPLNHSNCPKGTQASIQSRGVTPGYLPLSLGDVSRGGIPS